MNSRFPSSWGQTAQRPGSKRCAGFSRLDLTGTLAVLAGLAVLNIAAVSGNRGGTKAALCLANLRTLTQAWHLYATDKGYFPPNPDDGNVIPGWNWVPGQSGRGGGDEFNSDILKDPSRSLLVPYLSSNDPTVFRCPADLRVGPYRGNDPARLGTRVRAARSYAMNLAVGTNPRLAGGKVPTDGPWLDNNHSHTRGKTWRTYARFADVVAPTPDKLALLVDEDDRSINDGHYAFGMEKEEWIDWPATRHHVAAVVSFTDGHVELRRWLESSTAVSGSLLRRPVPGSRDYAWLRERISARLQP